MGFLHTCVHGRDLCLGSSCVTTHFRYEMPEGNANANAKLNDRAAHLQLSGPVGKQERAGYLLNAAWSWAARSKASGLLGEAAASCILSPAPCAVPDCEGDGGPGDIRPLRKHVFWGAATGFMGFPGMPRPERPPCPTAWSWCPQQIRELGRAWTALSCCSQCPLPHLLPRQAEAEPTTRGHWFLQPRCVPGAWAG